MPVVIANPLIAPVPTAYRMYDFNQRRDVRIEDGTERAGIAFCLSPAVPRGH